MSPARDIVVFGTGSVGGYLGGRLHGHAAVRFIARQRMADGLREHGMTLTDLHGYRRELDGDTLDISTSAADAIAPLVLVTVKSADTPLAARELAGVLPQGAIVISFQNGLANADVLRAALPGRVVLAGMVPFNVLQREPGTFHQGSSGGLMVEDHPALDRFLPMFAAAGLPLERRRDMPAVQRAKLLFNLNNAINALSGLPLRDELARRDWRRCLALAQREALDVFRALDLPVAKLTPLPPSWLPALLSLPDALFARIASRMLAIDPLARSSTWEDLQAGRRTEVDALHGAVAELAAQAGRHAPVNTRIVALVRAAEAEPAVWAAKDLLAELRRAQ